MNIEIWKTGMEASGTVRRMVYGGRDRFLSAFRRDVPRVVAKLSRDRSAAPGVLHACRLELSTRDGDSLTIAAQDARLTAAVERAFRDAARALRDRTSPSTAPASPAGPVAQAA